MDARTELKGMIKEEYEGLSKELRDAVEAKAVADAEANTKMLEENKELKDRMDDLQGKIVEINTKTSAKPVKVMFKGYDPEMSKNFKGCLNSEQAEAVAKAYLDAASGKENFEKVFDASGIMPVEYSNTILGLAELQSVGLSRCNVMVIDAATLKWPTKGTRDTADAQSPGTANTASTSTVGQLTFTIDKYIGAYVDVLKSEVADANVDFVNNLIIPMQGEAIGQYIDGEVFNGTNSIFTSSVIDCTASVTASGSVATAAAITFANLNTMFYSLEWERGIGEPCWFGSRAALKDVAGLLDNQNRPIFQQVPVNGRPSQTLMGCEYVIAPVIADAPANAAMRLCFGDPRQYTIVLRGNMEHEVNPYILMKEHKVQFIASIRADGNVSDHATASSSGAWTVMSRVDA